MPEVFRAVVVGVSEGRGVDGDPIRRVYYIYTDDLALLGRIDTWTDWRGGGGHEQPEQTAGTAGGA